MKTTIFTLLGLLLLAFPTSATNIERIDLGTFKLTAYSGSHQKRIKIPTTASGKVAKAGHSIAVDPRVIRLGSRVDVSGVGVRMAEDTGGRIKGKRIDVYMDSVGQAKQFGVRYASVALLLK